MITSLLFQIPQRYRFSSKSQHSRVGKNGKIVVLDTTKVQIFKQITTPLHLLYGGGMLFQIPQRYRFSSKSQHVSEAITTHQRCFRYHKGTDFQANHNSMMRLAMVSLVVLDTTKVQIFKQITTAYEPIHIFLCCFRYHKGTDFQANHNGKATSHSLSSVVLDTTKVQIFKQITTTIRCKCVEMLLFQIPQRYRFSSKSQQEHKRMLRVKSCFRYHKGTDFQANHNSVKISISLNLVVLDTTKVQIFKQITTDSEKQLIMSQLFQIPQRYRFSSKSQHH